MKRIKITFSGDPLTGAHDLIWRHLGWVYSEGVVILDTWEENPTPKIYPSAWCVTENVLLSLNTHGNWCLISELQEGWSGYCPLRAAQAMFWVDMAPPQIDAVCSQARA